MADFLDLPESSVKPRERGITHVLDRGLSLAEVDGLVEVAGGSVDVVKLGWGTAIATANLIPKLERYRHHGIPVVVGGTLTEAATRQRRIEPFIACLHEHDLRHIAISHGTIAIEPSSKRELIPRLAKQSVAFSEVGTKAPATLIAPY